jgi:nicotinate phosphoribosyltransferase
MLRINELSMLTDFYEFSMAYAYFKENRHEQIAYFDMFVRKLPDQGGYLIFNGLHRLVEVISNFAFDDDQIAYLRSKNVFDEEFLSYLKNIKLSVDIWSVPDGTVVFNNQPLVTVRGNVIEAQLIETILLLCVNYPTLVTTKASRIVNAAQGRAVIEFGARRAQGFDAAIEGARCAVIAGATGTSNTLAGYQHGLNISGTIAHSYIQTHNSEYDAFVSYAKINPDNCILLVDTYDTLKSGVVNAIKVAHEYLLPNGYRLKAIRLDSGDLSYLSKKARKMLDEAGLNDCKIIASNSLDENLIDDLITQQAQIDIFGVGENLITSKTTPVLGGVYKLVAQEIGEEIVPKIKISDNLEKITNPGFKKVVRFIDKETQKALGDCVMLADEIVPTDEYTLFDPIAPWKRKTITDYEYQILQIPIFVNGHLVYRVPTVAQTTEYCKYQMNTMWDEVKRLAFPHKYYVDLSQKLWDLKNQMIQDNRK